MKYKTINGWTKELIINAIKLGNNGTSFSVSGMCVYRNKDNNKCGVGVFIPDDLYHKRCEFIGVDSLLTTYPGLNDFMPLNLDGLRLLQSKHDNFSTNNVHEVLTNWINENVED